MPLFHVVLLAALQGAAEALPISRSGHGVVARLWLEPGGAAGALEAVLHLGTALALAISARKWLFSALGEGVRAVARPALFRESPAARDAAVIALGSAASLATAAVAGPRVEVWGDSPIATGLGLLVTGLALGSTALAPRAELEAPSPFGAVVVGIAHGLAVFPGASRVGAALTLLVWMGVKAGRAIDLAFALTIPALLVAFARGLGGRAGLDAGTIVIGTLLAFLTAAAAGSGLRQLAAKKRIGALALWIIPLGLAMLAYARALPHAS